MAKSIYKKLIVASALTFFAALFAMNASAYDCFNSQYSCTDYPGMLQAVKYGDTAAICYLYETGIWVNGMCWSQNYNYHYCFYENGNPRFFCRDVGDKEQACRVGQAGDCWCRKKTEYKWAAGKCSSSSTGTGSVAGSAGGRSCYTDWTCYDESNRVRAVKGSTVTCTYDKGVTWVGCNLNAYICYTDWTCYNLKKASGTYVVAKKGKTAYCRYENKPDWWIC